MVTMTLPRRGWILPLWRTLQWLGWCLREPQNWTGPAPVETLFLFLENSMLLGKKICEPSCWIWNLKVEANLRKRRVVLFARRKDSEEGRDIGEKGKTEGGALFTGHSHFFLLVSSYPNLLFVFCTFLVGWPSCIVIQLTPTHSTFPVHMLMDSQGRLLSSPSTSCPDVHPLHRLISRPASHWLNQHCKSESGESPGRSCCRMAVHAGRGKADIMSSPENKKADKMSLPDNMKADQTSRTHITKIEARKGQTLLLGSHVVQRQHLIQHPFLHPIQHPIQHPI